MASTDLIRLQFGQEVAWGTCVAATAKLMGLTDATLEVADEVYQTERGGWYYPSNLIAQVQQMGEGSVTFDLSYEDILFPLDNFFDEATPTGTTTITWNYDAPTDTQVTPNYLTIEYGGDGNEYAACGVIFTELNISGEAGSVWTGTFPFMCSDVETVTAASLSNRAVELIRMADTEIYVDTWSGTVGSTKLDDSLVSFTLAVQSGRHLKQFAGELSPQDWGDTKWTGQLTTVLEFNAGAKALVDAVVGGNLVQRMIRIQGSSGVKSATIDFYGTVVDGMTLFDDRDGNMIVTLVWEGTYNTTATEWLGVDVVNTVTALP
jgi:hypothetical protein